MIVLREDDNSEKTNSYIDAAMGKGEPIEKVSSAATSCGYVHTHLYIHHHHYRYSDLYVYSQWPIMASSLNCWNSINVISFRYVLYHIWCVSYIFVTKIEWICINTIIKSSWVVKRNQTCSVTCRSSSYNKILFYNNHIVELWNHNWLTDNRTVIFKISVISYFFLITD